MCAVQSPVGQERADLIARKRLPALRTRYRNRQAVGIRIIGDDQVDIALRCRHGKCSIQCTRLLGVGERHSREGTIRGKLAGDRNHLVTAVLENQLRIRSADAVERRVDDA